MNTILIAIYSFLAVAFAAAAVWCGYEAWCERHDIEWISYVVPIGVLVIFAHLFVFTISALL